MQQWTPAQVLLAQFLCWRWGVCMWNRAAACLDDIYSLISTQLAAGETSPLFLHQILSFSQTNGETLQVCMWETLRSSQSHVLGDGAKEPWTITSCSVDSVFVCAVPQQHLTQYTSCVKSFFFLSQDPVFGWFQICLYTVRTASLSTGSLLNVQLFSHCKLFRGALALRETDTHSTISRAANQACRAPSSCLALRLTPLPGWGRPWREGKMEWVRRRNPHYLQTETFIVWGKGLGMQCGKHPVNKEQKNPLISAQMTVVQTSYKIHSRSKRGETLTLLDYGLLTCKWGEKPKTTGSPILYPPLFS